MADEIALTALLLGAASTLVEEIHRGTARRGFGDTRPTHGFVFVRLAPHGATVTEVAVASAPARRSPRRGPPATTTMNTPCIRPRISSGAAICSIDVRRTALTMSAAPATARQTTASQSAGANPNPTIATPQDMRAAQYALGQAEGANAVPMHFWDAANGVWLNTDHYPNLWLDGRGGTGRPGDATSGTLTQGVDGSSSWAYETAHQPDLSYSDLARRSRVTSQSMHATVRQLEELGAVRRTLAGQGHRARLEVTERGQQLLDTARQAAATLDAQVMADVSDADRETFLRVLTTMPGPVSATP